MKKPTKIKNTLIPSINSTPTKEKRDSIPQLRLSVVNEKMISSKREVQKNEEKDEFDYFVKELDKIKIFVKIQQTQKKDVRANKGSFIS